MSHYTISYKGLTKDEAREKAIRDCKSWFGDRYSEIYGLIKDEIPTTNRRSIRFMLSFAGVKGLPAKVLFEEARAECNRWTN